MKIKIINNQNATKTEKGNLLEQLMKKVLEAQDYNVIENLRSTGVELDLYCSHNTDINKKIYVECKAYDESKKIQCDILWKLKGVVSHKEYKEGWLISTSELGKEAKGLREEFNQNKNNNIIIYDINDLIRNLVKLKVISAYIPLQKINNNVFDSDSYFLLITEYGFFWVVEIKESGSIYDILILSAQDNSFIDDRSLINKLFKLDWGNLKYNFKKQIELIESLEVEPKFKTEQNSKKNNKFLTYSLCDEYLKSIDDTGFLIIHHNKEVTLKDIFIYPDLQYIENDKKSKINSFDLIKKYDFCMIFGDDLSGKTSLARMFQKKLSDTKTTIYLDAKRITTNKKTSNQNLFKKAFKEQYGKDKVISETLNTNILIIDNFDEISIKKKEYLIKFLHSLSSYELEKIIIFSNESKELEILNDPEIKSALKMFHFFKIKQLGHILRDKVISKWINFGAEETIGDNDFFEKKDYIINSLNTSIKISSIPTYPLYIITLLSRLDTKQKQNTIAGSSAYADFFQYLIIQSLNNTYKIKPNELDFYNTYLSHLAYFFFSKKEKFLDSTTIENFHTEYSKNYHKESFDKLYNNLLFSKIIKLNCGEYSFSKTYIYNFYVAKYLADNVERKNKKDEVKKQLDSLINNIHISDNGNIILFFIHHSKARAESIIDKLLSQAKKLFEENRPANLYQEELKNIYSDTIKKVKLELLEDHKPSEYRNAINSINDDIDEEIINNEIKMSQDHSKSMNELDMFEKTNLSFKLIEILTQIAKSYYGSLENTDKIMIIKESILLGLRNLTFFIESIGNHKVSLVKKIEESLSQEQLKNIEDSEIIPSIIEKIINQLTYDFIMIFCLFFTDKVSSNISSKNLNHIIDDVGFESNSKSLIKIGALLKFPNSLNNKNIKIIKSLYSSMKKDNNFIPTDILRIIVAEYLYKFETEYLERQQICSALEIDVKPSKLLQNNSLE
ncbi:hypothetical protein LO80_01390 [Candidatus Francisella endociliophora]|uniref:Restriction endonuclease type IV Mrr domain-containing protein n=1 Tax=Candidatus Francisella endociliophora TaxID=653937 RepID=A0A097EMI3_9GAMM|nr:restriction endonuclease [Francisella sp. FSC1006]AIT08758.1 hypothetical protein LO80_01390 [Francisella sp. FSC1006]